MKPLQRTFSRRAILFGSQALASEDSANTAIIAENCLALSGIACRTCEDACEPRAIRFQARPGGHYHPSLDALLCTACGECVKVCPATAIALTRQADLDGMRA
jgi:ferredoxin-type protein NapF